MSIYQASYCRESAGSCTEREQRVLRRVWRCVVEEAAGECLDDKDSRKSLYAQDCVEEIEPDLADESCMAVFGILGTDTSPSPPISTR